MDLLERFSYLDSLCLQFYSLQYTWVKCMVQVSPVVAYLWCGTLIPHDQRHWKHVVPAFQRALLVFSSCELQYSNFSLQTSCILESCSSWKSSTLSCSLPRKKREKSNTCKDVQDICLKPVVTSPWRDLPFFGLYLALRLPAQVFWITSSIDEYRKDKLLFPCREQRMTKRAFISVCSTFIDFLLLLGEVLDLGVIFFLTWSFLCLFHKADNIHLNFNSNSLSSVNEAASSKIYLHVLAAKT